MTPDDAWPGAARLRQILAERGYGAQARLARALGIDNAMLSRIKQGKRVPRVDLAAAMCRELDISADWLLGLSDEPKRLSTAGLIRQAARRLEPHLEAVLQQALDAAMTPPPDDDGE